MTNEYEKNGGSSQPVELWNARGRDRRGYCAMPSRCLFWLPDHPVRSFDVLAFDFENYERYRLPLPQDPHAVKIGDGCGCERRKLAACLKLLQRARHSLRIRRRTHYPPDALLAEQSSPVVGRLKTGRINGPTGSRITIQEGDLKVEDMPNENKSLAFRFLARESFVEESHLAVIRSALKQIVFARYESGRRRQRRPVVVEQAACAKKEKACDTRERKITRRS